MKLEEKRPNRVEVGATANSVSGQGTARKGLRPLGGSRTTLDTGPIHPSRAILRLALSSEVTL